MIQVGNNHYGHWLIMQEDPEWLIVKKAMDLKASQYPIELRMLLAFVKSLNPSVVMEIGTHYGGTLWALSQVMSPDGMMVSLDYPMEKVDLAKRKAMMGSRCVKWIKANSHDVSTPPLVEDALGGKSVDFLFIDGGHLYESVRMDFEMYSPFVKVGGWIGFHDINVNPNDDFIDVNPFWMELKGFKFELSQYLPKNGIGIWRKDA
jgi:cephalosporin hydroxylase